MGTFGEMEWQCQQAMLDHKQARSGSPTFIAVESKLGHRQQASASGSLTSIVEANHKEVKAAAGFGKVIGA